MESEMNCMEKLKSKVIVTWEMKSERWSIYQLALRDLNHAKNEEEEIDLKIRATAAEMDYLLLEGWHDQYRAKLEEATLALGDPMEAEFQEMRDDVGAGE
jgi:hypothetical protein